MLRRARALGNFEAQIIGRSIESMQHACVAVASRSNPGWRRVLRKAYFFFLIGRADDDESVE